MKNGDCSETGPETYVVAACSPWSRKVFDQAIQQFPGSWHFVGERDALVPDLLSDLSPRYIFFLHWSWLVPQYIVSKYECVGFHMTDLPYGRGGTPLQNLIIRGHKATKLTALRLTEEMDAGPIYLKEPLTLEGSAQEIYERASLVSVAMIERMIQEHPDPVPQTGEPTVFTRRSPAQSEIPEEGTPEALYDFIRMLDAEGYPHAFIDHGGYRYNFLEAEMADGELNARVEIVPLRLKE